VRNVSPVDAMGRGTPSHRAGAARHPRSAPSRQRAAVAFRFGALRHSIWRRRDEAGAALAGMVLLLMSATVARAQVNGNVSVIADALPDLSDSPGAQPVYELRTRVSAEWRDQLGVHLRFNLSGYVDTLLADRGPTGDSSARAAIVRPGDFYVEYASDRFDLRAGMARLVWGRLDEFQPTDVVNPLDLTRFLLEGRSEARLPVALVRGRIFLPRSATVEAVAVPVFRPARFDQLAEDSSPFNLLGTGGATVERQEPEFSAQNIQGGVRLTATSGRVDWAVTGYRGFRAFPALTLVPTFAPSPLVVETFPRFTMVGGDFETVRGVWAVRGEVAAFLEDELQSTMLARGVPGRTIDAGVGLDRKAGSYRVAGDLLWSIRRVDGSDDGSDPGRARAASELNETDLSLVMAVDRSFARDTRTVRVFAVYDPIDDTTFARVIGAVSVRDNVWLEGSGGVFVGTSDDTLGRLSSRDFVYARLKVFF
jgi:hypothetical protein